MAVDTVIVSEGRSEFGARFTFHEVFKAEIAPINRRRALDSRAPIELEIETAEDQSGEPVLAPAENANVVGLALSGGGIRSAAFCLGALQAMETTGILKRVDDGGCSGRRKFLIFDGYVLETCQRVRFPVAVATRNRSLLLPLLPAFRA